MEEHVFEFEGTKSDFFEQLRSCSSKASYEGKDVYYFKNYIVEVKDNTVRFGVERAGHSGGHWFVPTITEHERRVTFCGKLEYVGPLNENKKQKTTIGDIFLYMIGFPFLLVIAPLYYLYRGAEWIIRKLFKTTRFKEKTREEKLYDLMENHLGCVRKETGSLG